MKTGELKSVLSEIGGPEFLKTSHYLIAAAVLLMTGVSIGIGMLSPIDIALYALANLVSLTFTAIPFIVIRFAHRYMNRNFTTLEVVASGLFLGLVKAATTGASVWFLGLEEIAPALSSRLVSGALIGAVLVVMLSVLPVVSVRYEIDRASLIRDSVAARLAASIKPISDSITMELKVLLENDSKTDVAVAIEDLVQNRLRPFSKDLWEQASKRYPKFEFRSLLSRGYHSASIPLIPLLVIYTLGSPGLKLLLSGHWAGFQVIVTQLVGIFLCVMFANWLKNLGRPELSMLVAVTGISFSLSFGPELIGAEIQGYNPQLGMILLFFNASFNVVLLTTISTGLKAKQLQDSELERSQKRRIDAEAEDLSRILAARRAAEILHGQVQNRLLAAAVRIGDAENDYRAEISDLMSRMKSLHIIEQDLDPQRALAEIATDWRGVIDVNFALQGSIRPFNFELFEAIRESVSNSHKHGLASSIHINVRFGEGLIYVEVVDDGIGPRSGKAGLGQRLLDALGPWSLTVSEQGGAKLTFVAKS